MLIVCVLFSLSIGGLFARGEAEGVKYPDRPVTIIVPWGAGGGTDTITRIFAIGFEKELGVPVNVVNRTGGNGIVGHEAIVSARPDGYTIGMATSEITYFKTLGLGEITPDDFDLISRIALIPAGVTVRADSDYENLDEFLAAIRSEPKNTFSSSGSGLGGPWHMAIAGLVKAAGMAPDKVQWIPSQGGAPALQDMLAGGISMFTGSPVEAKALMEAGEVRTLAIMSEKRSPAFPNVPTVKEASGLDWTLENWFGLVLPKGVPAEVRSIIIEKARAAQQYPEVQDALAQRGITPVWDGPEGFTSFASSFTETAAALLTELGIAK
jgi:tripartite-type tricarboxylate transporter receptor subunit TctC